MNAILGVTRPGDFGADMMHFNPHKTFSGPHGGGGPARDRSASADGSNRICRRRWSCRRPTATGWSTIGHVDRPRARLLRQCRRAGSRLRYIRTHGPDGSAASGRKRGPQRQLPAQSRQTHPARAAWRSVHARVRGDGAELKKERGVTAMDLAKRLLDYGFHAPTVYFPLTVPECLMIEPTETESKETLDAFAETLFRITEESAEMLHEAPHATHVSRPDEVRAARQPVMRWQPQAAQPSVAAPLP